MIGARYSTHPSSVYTSFATTNTVSARKLSNQIGAMRELAKDSV